MPKNDMEELAKIPALISHFEKHQFQHQGHKLSFTQFLIEHYKSIPCDGDSHEDLPFFKHQIPGLVFLIPKINTSFLPGINYLEPIQHAPDPKGNLLSYFGLIWQPPQC